MIIQLDKETKMLLLQALKDDYLDIATIPALNKNKDDSLTWDDVPAEIMVYVEKAWEYVAQARYERLKKGIDRDTKVALLQALKSGYLDRSKIPALDEYKEVEDWSAIPPELEDYVGDAVMYMTQAKSERLNKEKEANNKVSII